MKSTTTTVAQAISFAVDEVQEYGTSDGAMGLFLDRDSEDLIPEEDLRVTEVSAQLQNSSNGLASIFQVTTSDGKVWDVRVTPSVNG